MASTLQETREALEARRVALARDQAARSVELPVAHWRQWAHLTTPASDGVMARKAVEQGLLPAARLLEKLGIGRSELAERLDVATADVDAVLDGPPHAPLVLLDGEDAQALTDEVVLAGRRNAVEVLRTADPGRALRYYRPSGLELPYATDDLLEVLLGVGEDRPPESYPVDGVMWPKAQSAGELRWLCELLDEVERRLSLPRGRIRLQFLVESGWSVLELPALVQASLPRLSGIVFGIADHAADLGLPEIVNDHPASDHARLAIVNAAGAAGVPAIDAMTLAYPVTDKALDAAANRERILQRLRLVFDHARHGQALGMSGKWVGHPAQLLAVLIAARTALPRQRIEAEARRLEAYQEAVATARGATIIDGLMTDRANDRHSRTLLRQAVAWGALDVPRALRLEVISADEARQLLSERGASA